MGSSMASLSMRRIMSGLQVTSSRIGNFCNRVAARRLVTAPLRAAAIPLVFALTLAVAEERARAQDPVHETVVVTAATTPVPLGSVTRTLTVITREEIAQLPVHSLADVLRLASSVDVRARGARGVQTDFAMRGAHFGQ